METPEVFRNDEPGYVSWLERHERGFVLNLWPVGSSQVPMLHSARCMHIYYPEVTYTHTVKRPKACSEDRVTLERWAHKQGYSFKLCSSCDL